MIKTNKKEQISGTNRKKETTPTHQSFEERERTKGHLWPCSDTVLPWSHRLTQQLFSLYRILLTYRFNCEMQSFDFVHCIAK